ncbi:MAG: hypothetical protein WBQ21_11465 [Solirubrobacteraceae bacterium]
MLGKLLGNLIGKLAIVFIGFPLLFAILFDLESLVISSTAIRAVLTALVVGAGFVLWLWDQTSQVRERRRIRALGKSIRTEAASGKAHKQRPGPSKVTVSLKPQRLGTQMKVDAFNRRQEAKESGQPLPPGPGNYPMP